MTVHTRVSLTEEAREACLGYLMTRVRSGLLNTGYREHLRDIDSLYVRSSGLEAESSMDIPVVYSQVESAVTYQASVFCTGTPLFDVIAAPEHMDEARALSAKIDADAIRGGWTHQFILAFRQAFRYQVGAVEVSWGQEKVPVLATVPGQAVAEAKKVLWQGNKVTAMNMYNTFWDPRVPANEVHTRGEYAGYVLPVPYTELVSLLQDETLRLSPEMLAAARESVPSVRLSYVPTFNHPSLFSPAITGQTDWAALWGLTPTGRVATASEITTIYARVVPSAIHKSIRVPAPNSVQVWKFTVVNGLYLISAEVLSNAHNYLPILFFQPLADGLGYSSKSLAQNVAPVQTISSTLLKSVIAAQQRAISDRGIYDPTMIDPDKINSAIPNAKIPIRALAFGRSLAEAYLPIPFRDENSAMILQMLPSINSMANVVSGQNPARQGQFVKGNKTQQEFDTVMQNANGRDQLVAIHLEAALFTPLKEILKVNLLQFGVEEMVLARGQEGPAKFDPIALRKAAVSFKVSDGEVPTNKVISFEALQAALQALASNPGLAAGYDLAAMFSYLMKTQHADLEPFQKPPEQVAYEQALGAWQQAAAQAAQAGTSFSTPMPQQPKEPSNVPGTPSILPAAIFGPNAGGAAAG